MARKKRLNYVRGAFTHRRTESDYMATLLDAVTLEDWREIVNSTVAAAKGGDTSARTFLAQYLVGRPDLKAPAPVTVVVQQLSGCDPLVEKLAKPHIDRIEYPSMHENDDLKDAVKGFVAEELRTIAAQSLTAPELAKNADKSTSSSDPASS
jgi:hypothetical protein